LATVGREKYNQLTAELILVDNMKSETELLTIIRQRIGNLTV
jgi:hypothetical protein